MKFKLIIIVERIANPLFVFITLFITNRYLGGSLTNYLATVYLSIPLAQFLISFGIDQNLQVIISNSANNWCLVRNEITTRIKRVIILCVLLYLVFILGVISINYNFIIIGILIGGLSAAYQPCESYLVINSNFGYIAFAKYASMLISILISFSLFFLYRNESIFIIALLLIEKLITGSLLFLFSNRVDKIKLLNMPHSHLDSIDKSTSIPKINFSVILSAIGIFIYNRIDQVYLSSPERINQLGVYFSTIKFFETINMAVGAVLMSYLKDLMNVKVDILQEKKIIKFIFYGSVISVTVVSLSVPYLLELLFHLTPPSNCSYIYAIAISTIFGIIGSLKGPWVAKNNRFTFNMACTSIGSAVSIGYLYLIQPDSLLGIALSVVLGQITTNLFVPVFWQIERQFLKKLI